MFEFYKNASGVMKKAIWAASASLLAVGFTSCSKNDDVAGGVTDIGNSIATGVVVTEANVPAARARVVAYYDSWDKTAIEDSVETIADENGFFSITVDSTRNVVLFAENGTATGLSHMQNSTNTLVVVGHPRRLESSIANANSGDMRIVGSKETVPVNENGSFAFDSMPLGEISLTYVAEGKPKARINFMTAIVGDTLKIPSLENLEQNNDWLTIADYRYYSGVAYAGIMVDVPEGITVPEQVIVPQDSTPTDTTVKDTSTQGISISLHLDGEDTAAKVYNSDGSLADPDSVEYVEGISGKGISLKIGQYVGVGNIDPTAGDFTLSAWTLWKGFRVGTLYQLLYSQRISWAKSAARFQLQYDFLPSTIVAVSDGVTQTGYVTLSIGNTEKGGYLPPNEWAHIVLVNKSGLLYLYINGELVSEKTGKAFIPKNFDEPLPFCIGGSETPNDTWNGIIDEVTIESTARSAEWVKAEYEKFAK